MQEVYEKKIDWVFFNEKRIEKAVYEARIDCPKSDVAQGGDRISKNKISDPTAQTAINNLSPLSFVVIGGKEIKNRKGEKKIVGGEILKYPEHWLAVIGKTYDWCKRQSEIHFNAVKRKYIGEHYHRICRELNISPTTLRSYIHRAKMYAALQAVQFGLIYID